MGLVVPESYVSTADAYSQMLQADSEWCRCSAAWEAGGRSLLDPDADAAIAEISERQEALIAELYKAVIADEIALFAYTRRELFRTYPDGPGRDQRKIDEGDARIETELRTGRIKAGKVDSPERQEIDGAALCFRQADWCVWLAARFKPEGDSKSAEVTESTEVNKVEKQPAGEPRRGRPAKPTFDEVSAWYAQRVIDYGQKRLPPSRSEDEKAAKQYFAAQDLNGRGIRDLVRRARERHAPASWKETGAKSHEAYDDDRKARAAIG